MRRITLTLLAAAMLAVPAAASAQTPAGTGQAIPVPAPILTHLGHTPMVENWDGGGGLPYLGATASYNAGDWENALRTYHDTGVYDQQVTKVDAVASKWLSRVGGNHGSHKFKFKRGANDHVKIVRIARHGKGHHGNGHHGNKHQKKLAVVFDIDETLLSNYSAINADNFTFGTASKAETTNETGVAIPASLALFNQAKNEGMTVFLITGRGETPENRQHTEHNLNREGYSGWKQLFLKPAGFTGTTTDYKSGTRAGIEKQGYRIVASVGDQYSDLSGGHEDVAFKLANPFYFLP
jgi:putative acid phosphatase of HAD superfamily subfamily IIIB